MARPDVSKVLFLAVVILASFGGAVLFGMYSVVRENFVYRLASNLKSSVDEAYSTVRDEASTLTRTRPDWFLQPAYYEGDGVTVNSIHDGKLILIAGFFEGGNQIRLIERDGAVVAKWPIVFSSIFPDDSHIHAPPATDWNVDMHGTLILPDGSVVFNFEHSGLAKLDRCGAISWTVARETHHSVETAEAGGFWVPGSHFVTDPAAPEYPPFAKPYYEDTILRISDDGEILSEKSVVEIPGNCPSKQSWRVARCDRRRFHDIRCRRSDLVDPRDESGHGGRSHRVPGQVVQRWAVGQAT